MFGRAEQRWGKIHWAIPFVTFNLVFSPCTSSGCAGCSGIYDYTQYTLKGLQR
jgi:hypothetical protein